jgi:uncharacterized repeat protein (TIGR01451 family)
MNFPAYRVEAILAAAVEIPSDGERREFVDRECAGDAGLKRRVEELIDNHFRAGSFLESPARPFDSTDEEAARERPGTVVGPYKLMEQIGEGGMGLVFVAEQTQPVRRKVALKIIKPGMDSRDVLARFEAERQALALMDHPNIARVLDAGTTPNGQPYFVMELVKGIAIVEYCDRQQLTARERLDLFVSVCQAVQHAHGKGIIHRDLKPSNILVAPHDGVPVVKVIDFGVAKAVGQRLTDKTVYTRFAQMIGTPLYMSPEQAELNALDVDIRSDVYTLGVLLYELLTGTTPFDRRRFAEAAFDEIRRIIREEEPPKPSTRISTLGATLAEVSARRKTEPAKLSALVRGDLDWIVMKALEKDRDRRYETASALAADVRRYLHNEPVQACPPSVAYRLRKFVRRNRGPVLAGALVFVALVAGIIGTTWGMIRATGAQAVAVNETRQKEAALGMSQQNEREAREQLFLALRTGQSAPPVRPTGGRPRKFLPGLEFLEARLVPTNFPVTSLTDSNAVGSGSLRRAITDANATAGSNGINILTPGTYTLTLNGFNDDNTAGDLDILNSVTIQNMSGGRVVIDAGGLTNHDRVFDISPTGPAVNVTIQDVTIQGGNTTEGGGGIRVQAGSNLVLINDIVQNNTAGSAGGGGVLDLGSGNFTITDSLIANNTAGKSNNGFGGGGVRVENAGDVTVTGSQFTHNSTTGDGGGLLVFNTTTSLLLASSTFNANHAGPVDNATGGNGAGLDLPTNNANLSDVTVSGNSADGEGGGIACAATVTDGIILRNVTVAFNTAGDRGGGILSNTSQGSVRLVNTIVAKNTAGVGGHPDVDNDNLPGGLVDDGHNLVGSEEGADTIHTGTPNTQGSFVGPIGLPSVLLDPLLGPLADNGGAGVLPDGSHVLTHLNLANTGNNGVRDRGTDTGAPASDERGFLRLVDTHVDIGAFEFQDYDVTVNTPAPVGMVMTGQAAIFPVTVTNNGPNPSHGVLLTDTLPAGTVAVAAPGSMTVSGTTVTFAVPDLAPRASTAFNLTVVPPAPGTFTSAAAVSAPDDASAANNTAAISVVVVSPPAPAPVPFPATGAADVTGLVRIVRQGRHGARKRLLLLLTNTGGTPIRGPLGLVVQGLRRRRGVRLLNTAGLTADRLPFVRSDAGGDNVLSPGESVSVALVFSQPFAPPGFGVLAGAFA